MATTRGKTPRCKYCNEWVDKTLEHEKTSKGYYHKPCHDVVSTEGQHYKELCEVIQNRLGVDFSKNYPRDMIVTQIKRFKEKKEYKYKGIEMTLHYLLDVKGKTFHDIDESGIQLVEWFYDETREYYVNIQEVLESFVDAKIDNTPEVIKIKRNSHNSGVKKLINMEEL